MSALLTVSGLSCRYGDRLAVDRLDLEVQRGEIFGLLGPNGAGKSTVFKVLSGLRDPDAGALRWEGAPFDPRQPAARRSLGVVFQDPSLDEQLTGRENLQLLAALHGLRGPEARARIDDALRLVELSERQHDAVKSYSGGMKRRLELARVVLHRPALLLMDEPSRGLDPASLRRYWAQLIEWQRAAGLTILLTTHIPEEAEYCQRIAVLDQGRLIACATPDELRRRVGGELIRLEADDAAGLLAALRPHLPAAASPVQVGEDFLLLEAAEAHRLIPRLVEELPPGRLRSVSLRRPSLADVFIKLTGRSFDAVEDAQPEAA